jgi:hypothetical protein
VARAPLPEELKTLQRLLAQQMALNETISGTPPGLDANTFAAWTTVARVLLNLDETITRE